MTRDREPVNHSRRRMMATAGIAGLAALAPLSAKADDPDAGLVRLWKRWQHTKGEAEALTEAASEAWSRVEDLGSERVGLVGHGIAAASDMAEYTKLTERAKAACAELDLLEQDIVETPARGPLGVAAKLEVALDHLDEAESRAGTALRAAAHDARKLGSIA